MPASSRAAITAGDWIARAARRLRNAKIFFGHGTSDAGDEAAWLLAHACALTPVQMAGRLNRQLAAAHRQRADELLAQRIRLRTPAAYLLREAWLGGRRFYVDERVIVPRSFIAELLQERLHPWIGKPAQIRSALDLCTGSGCLAIVMAGAFRAARVDAADISAGALEVAAINVRRHRLSRRVHLLHSDLFAQVPRKRYDLIIANPPYVNSAAMRTLPAEYRREPPLALAGGRDGLALIRRIIERAPDYLAPHGLLVMEIGHNRKALEKACPRTAFTWLETSGGDGFVFLATREQLPGTRTS